MRNLMQHSNGGSPPPCPLTISDWVTLLSSEKSRFEGISIGFISILMMAIAIFYPRIEATFKSPDEQSIQWVSIFLMVIAIVSFFLWAFREYSKWRSRSEKPCKEILDGIIRGDYKTSDDIRQAYFKKMGD